MKLTYKKILTITICVICITFQNVFAVTEPTIYSEAAIAIDAESGIVLYKKNENKKVYPASVTKILTAILALENLDLDKSVVVSKTALSIPWDSSIIYLAEGEILTVRELLYGLLLNSGNDAANVLAEATSGSITEFVKLMNEKAKELGCTGSNFINAHGYTSKSHYTTASDISKIFKYCIQNDEFVKIISTKSYTINPTNKTTTKRVLETKEECIYARPYKYAIGGKTGYINESGKTFVAFGKKDDKTVIIATFNAGTIDNNDARYTDAINLFDYSFDNFKKQTYAKISDYSFNYINSESKLKYTLEMKDDVNILSNSNGSNKTVSYVLDIDEDKLNKCNESNNETKDESYGQIKFIITDGINNYTLVKDLVLKNIDNYTIVTKDTIWTYTNCILIALFIITIITIRLLTKPSKQSIKSNLKNNASLTKISYKTDSRKTHRRRLK